MLTGSTLAKPQMPTILVLLALVVLVLLAVCLIVQKSDWRKTHPTFEDKQKKLTRAYSLDEFMSADQYEKELDKLFQERIK